MAPTGADRPLPGPILVISLTESGLGVAAYQCDQQSDPDSLRIDFSVTENADQHSERLMPAIHELLESCRVGPTDLAAIAFNAGPGGFTRVRVACAVAQGIAMGCDIPVAAVDSLQATAVAAFRAIPFDDCMIAVCDDARMGECYVGVYLLSRCGGAALHDPVQLRVEQNAGLLPFAALGDWLTGLASLKPAAARPVYVVGDGLARYQASALPSGIQSIAQPGAADTLHALINRLRVDANWQPADRVGPLYVRDKVALNVTEQAALRAQRGKAS